MPAARSLKPLLKLTLLLCVLFVFYRSFVLPRLFPSSLSLNDDKKLLVPGGVGLEAIRKAEGGGGGEYFKDAVLGGGEQVKERLEQVKKKIHQEEKKVKAPIKLDREMNEKDQEFNEIVKQVPDEVPVWVVAKEQERVEGNEGDWRNRLESLREEESEKKRKERLAKGGEEEDEDTFEKEMEAMEVRKGQRGGKSEKQRIQKGEGGRGGEKNEKPTKVSQDDVELADDVLEEDEEEAPVYHLVDEDDDLDAAQKGDGDKRKALSGQRKKGPLIQVGGAGNAAGDKAGVVAGAVAGAGVDAVKPKGKDKWQGKGWDQRFKKQGGEKEKEETEKEGTEAEDQSTSSDEAVPPIEEKEASNPAKLLVQHALVARFLQQDISHTGGGSPRQRSQVKFVSPEDEDAASEDQPKKVEATAPPPLERHNLTVCALIPNEQRFLPEWLLYHSLLGVSRFALYDTTLPGTFGGGEIDSLADTMREEGGGGENAPTVEELKAQVAYANAGREGLDEKGLIRRERVRGLEDWIDKGRVKMSYMKFKNPRASHDVHALMLENCIERFGATSNWLAHLDVDEFISFNTPLYGSDEPYSSSSSATSSSDEPSPDHLYPLHDLLSSPALDSALCVPVPELSYRNLGIKELKRSQGVLETQVHRDVLGEVKESKVKEDRGSLPQKTLIHTAFSSEPGVAFSGPHSCELLATADNSDDGIRDSQGNILASRGGLYHSQNLPIEPLAIAHYVQRDLLDCHSKLSSVSDPLSLLPKGRGSVSCEAHYLPSASELSSTTWREDPANEVLKTVPALGSVVEDKRMRMSWAGRAAKEIGDAWRKSMEKGMRRTSKAERERLVSRVLHKVEVITY